MWVYCIQTLDPDDSDPLLDALGDDYFEGNLSRRTAIFRGKPSNIWRFEIDRFLSDERLSRLRYGSPGMAGYTEVFMN